MECALNLGTTVLKNQQTKYDGIELTLRREGEYLTWIRECEGREKRAERESRSLYTELQFHTLDLVSESMSVHDLKVHILHWSACTIRDHTAL